jgi:hypothetical protein
VGATDTIVDATGTTRVAYAALDGSAAGGPLTLSHGGRDERRL